MKSLTQELDLLAYRGLYKKDINLMQGSPERGMWTKIGPELSHESQSSGVILGFPVRRIYTYLRIYCFIYTELAIPQRDLGSS